MNPSNSCAKCGYTTCTRFEQHTHRIPGPVTALQTQKSFQTSNNTPSFIFYAVNQRIWRQSTIACLVSRLPGRADTSTYDDIRRYPNPKIHYTAEIKYQDAKIIFARYFPSHFNSVLAKSCRQESRFRYQNRQYYGNQKSADYSIHGKSSIPIQSIVTTHQTNY